MAEPTDEARITLRLPVRLRDELVQSASENARSMNGEIVYRLEEVPRLQRELEANEKLLENREKRLFAELSERRKWEKEGTDRDSLFGRLREAEAQIEELKKKTISLREFEYVESEYQRLTALPLAEDRTLYVLLDVDGSPISWPEILANVEEIANASGASLEKIDTRVFDAKIVGSGAREEAFLRLIKKFRDQRKTKPKASRGPIGITGKPSSSNTPADPKLPGLMQDRKPDE